MILDDHTHPIDDGGQFDRWAAHIQENFDRARDKTLYTTDVDPTTLWETFLYCLPTEWKQYHNCKACKAFIERYGGLVTIDTDSKTHSALWTAYPGSIYGYSEIVMGELAEAANVNGIFVSSDEVLGTPEKGDWTHLAVAQPSQRVWRSRTKTAGQRMAEYREDYRTLYASLGEVSIETLQRAYDLLVLHQIGVETIQPQLAWFLGVNQTLAETPSGRSYVNRIWQFVAEAAEGWAQPRGRAYYAFVLVLHQGESERDALRTIQSYIHPLAYQRNTVAPKAGQVDRANKLIEQLGLEPALYRRFARLEECELVWQPAMPKTPRKPRPGPMSGLERDARTTPDFGKPPASSTPIAMSYRRFERTILPHATQMWYKADHAHYTTICGPVHADAPLLFTWDHPYSWYLYHGGNEPSAFGLMRNAMVRVTGITYKPHQWRGGRSLTHKEGAIFLLEGCVDQRNHTLALFPTMLRGELHEVHATIWSYSQINSLRGKEEASAAGPGVDEGNKANILLKVDTATSSAYYRIEDWD